MAKRARFAGRMAAHAIAFALLRLGISSATGRTLRPIDAFRVYALGVLLAKIVLFR